MANPAQTKSNKTDKTQSSDGSTRKGEYYPNPASPYAEILSLQNTVGNRSMTNLLLSGSIQAKVKVGKANDKYEQEANRVADQVMRIPEYSIINKNGAKADHTPPKIQRTCSQCKEEDILQRKQLTVQQSHLSSTVESQLNNLKGGGQPLDPATRTFFDSRFGNDFNRVRVHTDSQSSQLAKEVNARAFTYGRNLIFASGEYNPGTLDGKHLLAHELTHVIQQKNEDKEVNKVRTIRRQHNSSENQPNSNEESRLTASNYRRITMHFDGEHLIVFGDGKEVFRFSAQSGRPVLLSEEHAEQCGADRITDTYMNDKRFVGIRQFGPIPEGSYQFSPPRIQRFSTGEQFRLVTGGIIGNERVKVSGGSVHAGDWGSGRVALHPRGRVHEGPCGNASRRSGFYLHGGIMAGSSGCVDIGGDFSDLADFLSSFRRRVVLTVHYETEPTSVGALSGLSGAVAYGHFGFAHGPSLRLGSEFSQDGTRLVTSVGYNALLQWAGGALNAGLRLDIPISDRSAFVRTSLEGGVNFRLFRALYGHLFGGVHLEFPTEGEIRLGGEIGTGVGYDFGPVQAEALYNILRPMSNDQRVHQVLLNLGVRF